MTEILFGDIAEYVARCYSLKVHRLELYESAVHYLAATTQT